jgi:photosystem II stability/assembly factor-like uncharacterized protein
MRPRFPFRLSAVLLAALVACDTPPGATTDARGGAARTRVAARWAELPMLGEFGEELTLAPDGRLWIGTRQGEIFTADSVNGDWRRVAGPPAAGHDDDDLDEVLDRPAIDRVTWVDARTAIASGYIGRGSEMMKDAVLRTADGGATWDTVSMGVYQWTNDAFVDRDGGVWMAGSEGTLVFSGDGGRTWETRSPPFGTAGRVRAIWMEDGRTGVAAAPKNALKLTRDGGWSWQRLPTPLGQKRYRPDDTEYNDHRFEAVALLGGVLWAVQENHLFTSPLSPVRWREVGPERLVMMAVDRAAGEVYAVGESRHVYQVAGAGAPRRITRAPLYAPAASLAARGGVAYVVDREGGLYRVSPGRTVYSRPLTRGDAAPRLSRVAAGRGRTWAASEYGLYTGGPGGRGWVLTATSPRPIAGMAVLGDGRVMLWDGHGANVAFDPAARRMEEIAGLHGDDVVKVIGGDSVWLAYGGRQYESAMRVDVARTFRPNEFAGSRPNGFIYRSRDRGLSWAKVAEWPEHGVVAVFPHADGALTLFSYRGSVRRLTPDAGGYRADTLVTATDENRDSVPYAQVVGALYVHGAEGWMDGWIHHRGNVRYLTHDGGRSWTAGPLGPVHYQALCRSGGRWIASTGHRLFLLSGDSARQIYDGGGKEARFDIEGDTPSIVDVAEGPEGSVTALLRTGAAVRVGLPAAR